jgi:hypothetical protein
VTKKRGEIVEMGATSVKGGYGGENLGGEANMVTDHGGLLSMGMGIHAHGRYAWT